MKGKLLAWLLLMILSSLALTHSSFQLEHRQGHDVNLSRLHGQETIHVEGVPSTISTSEGDYGSRSNKGERDLLVVSEKGQKGKTGVYGGGNSAHRSPQDSAAHCPKTMLHLSFCMVLICFFKLL